MSEEAGARDRLRWLVRTWGRWILAIVLLVVAVLVGASWSLGLFSSSSPNPQNTVSAGSMTQDNTADNAAIIQATGMVPGDVVTGSATIKNAGDAHGDFTLDVTDVTDAPGPKGGELSMRLNLAVREGSKVISIGPLALLDVDLGDWAPGEEHTYQFEVRFPEGRAEIDDTFQRSSATATFEWNAIQSH